MKDTAKSKTEEDNQTTTMSSRSRHPKRALPPAAPGTFIVSTDSATEIPLTAEEKKDFERLTKIVLGGIRAAIGSADALFEIRERRLYREQFQTFESYCQEILHLTRQYVNRLIRAGKVRSEMETIVSKLGLPLKLPESEAVLQELGRLRDPSDMVEVYREAIETHGKDVPARKIREITTRRSLKSSEKPKAQKRRPSAQTRIQWTLSFIEACESDYPFEGKMPQHLLWALRMILEEDDPEELIDCGLLPEDVQEKPKAS